MYKKEEAVVSQQLQSEKILAPIGAGIFCYSLEMKAYGKRIASPKGRE